MSKQNKTAGKTAERKPLRAYILDAIKRYSSANPEEKGFVRIAGNALVGAAFAELVAIRCNSLCATFGSFGLMKGGVA